VASWSAVPADAKVFLGRLTRLDPGALVRLRPAGADRTVLWARLPWGVLVTREVAAAAPGDVTVGATALLAVDGGPWPARRDREWRWPLPPHPGEVLEQIPARKLAAVAAAAARTLREVAETGLAGQPVGSRVLREALLDHVAIRVDPGAYPDAAGAGKLEIPQRLVQGVIRMGFLGRVTDTSSQVRVRRADRWVALAARYGTGWLPPPSGPLTVRPVRRGPGGG
jgi:hypothetical protein